MKLSPTSCVHCGCTDIDVSSQSSALPLYMQHCIKIVEGQNLLINCSVGGNSFTTGSCNCSICSSDCSIGSSFSSIVNGNYGIIRHNSRI